MCQIIKDEHNLEFGANVFGSKTKSALKSKICTIDDALELTKFGKFNYAVIGQGGMILSAVLMESLGISYVLPVSQCDMNLSTEDKGILSAVGFAGIICSSFVWGYLADTAGRKRVMQPTLLLAFLCTFLSTFTSNFVTFALLRFLNGFFISGSSATIYAYLGEFHIERYRSKAIMYASVIYGVVCILLPVIAWLTINQNWILQIPLIGTEFKPWRLFLIVCAIPSLMCSIGFYFLPESPKFALGQGDQEAALAILNRINRWNNGKNAEALSICELYEEAEAIENRRRLAANCNSSYRLLRSIWAQIAPLFMKSYLRTTLLACAIQFGIFLTSNGLYMWFPDILNRVAVNMREHPDERILMCDIVYRSKANVTTNMDSTATEVNCVTELDIFTYEHSIILEVIYALGFAVIGIIINAVGKLAILFGLLLVCGLAGIASIFADTPLLAIYLYVTLLACGLAVTVVNASTVDLYPTNLRAMAVCVSLMMGRVGSVVGANMTGLLLDNYCEAVFSFNGICLIMCGSLAFFIPKIQKPNEPRPIEPRVSVISSRIAQ